MKFRKMQMWLYIALIAHLMLIQAGFVQGWQGEDIADVAALEFRDPILLSMLNLPDGAVIGSTPERKSAYYSLSEEQKGEMFTLVGPYLDRAIEEAKRHYAGGNNKNINTTNISEEWANAGSSVPTRNITDSFKVNLADKFTPIYNVSNGEIAQFATFKNQATLEVK